MQTCVRLNAFHTTRCGAAYRQNWHNGLQCRRRAGLRGAGRRSFVSEGLGGALRQGVCTGASALQQQTSLCRPVRRQQQTRPQRWHSSSTVAHAATTATAAEVPATSTASTDNALEALRAGLEVCFSSSDDLKGKPERWMELLLAHALLPHEGWVVEGTERRLPLEAASMRVMQWLGITYSTLMNDKHLRRFSHNSSDFILGAGPGRCRFLSTDSTGQNVAIDTLAVQNVVRQRLAAVNTMEDKRQLVAGYEVMRRYQPWDTPTSAMKYVAGKLALIQASTSGGKFATDTSYLSTTMTLIFGADWRGQLGLPKPGELADELAKEPFWKSTSGPHTRELRLDIWELLKEWTPFESMAEQHTEMVLGWVPLSTAATIESPALGASVTPARSGLFGGSRALHSSDSSGAGASGRGSSDNTLSSGERSKRRKVPAAEPKFCVGQWYRLEMAEDSSLSSSSSSSSSSGSGSSSRSLSSADQEPAEEDVRLLTAAMQSVQGHADADSLVHLLPDRLHPALQPHLDPSSGEPALLEIIIDEGRPVELRLADGSFRQLPSQYNTTVQEALSALGVAATAAGSQPASTSSSVDGMYYSDAALAGGWQGGGSGKRRFGSDNRLTLPGTLHRISAIKDKWGEVTGLTYRVGRHLPGLGRLIQDVLADMAASLQQGTPRSLLLLGRPGLGKTTLLRDIARTMSDPESEGGLGLNVMVIDTSNEIAGDGPVPHSCIGRARRMMVGSRREQAAVMVEAVQNHTPQVIIIDEMGTKEEVAAARTIAERGVLLVATAHGNTLQNVLRNPELRPLLGNVQPVILGDKIASRTNQGRKMRLERSGPATFPILVELQAKNRWRLHPDVEHNVDNLLAAEGGLLDDPTASSIRSQYGSISLQDSDSEDWESSDEEGEDEFGDPYAKDYSKGPQRLVTQLRGFAASGDVLLQFETKAAAAAWEAQA